jgi:V/A-type H+-transporting ATPase subunit E
MSLEAILTSIEDSGQAEIDRVRADAELRAQQILVGAKRKASTVREEARRAAAWPAAGERARRLHQAKLEALRIVGAARDRLVEATLTETRQRLAGLRANPDYELILRRLIQQAVDALGERELRCDRPVLEIDGRDEAHVRHILAELGLDLSVVSSLDCWGGVVATSGDGRVVVNNTLESRLERAGPFLRQDVVAFIEKEMITVV